MMPIDRFKYVCFLSLLTFFMGFSFGSGAPGIVEIEVNGTAQPTFVPTSQPVSVNDSPSDAARTVVHPSFPTNPNASISPTPLVVQGVFKMKDLYQSGVRAYRGQDYEKAIRYLKAALDIHDPYTSKYYYAETHAMLGVIYQFFYPVPDHLEMAKTEYEAALQIDPKTKSASKHLAELSVKVKP